MSAGFLLFFRGNDDDFDNARSGASCIDVNHVRFFMVYKCFNVWSALDAHENRLPHGVPPIILSVSSCACISILAAPHKIFNPISSLYYLVCVFHNISP